MDFENVFFFFPIYGLKQPDLRKKWFFLSGQGGLPPYTLSGPTTHKKHFFMCVLPNLVQKKQTNEES